jgi:hypothetical protein
MMRLTLFSRPINSGKTTELLSWCGTQEKAGGILMPDRDGKRCMHDIASGEEWAAQCDDPNTAANGLLTIGRFAFYKVIDETGKLELAQKGFYTSLIETLDKEPVPHLLLVVRDTLLEETITFFQLKAYRVVSRVSEII